MDGSATVHDRLAKLEQHPGYDSAMKHAPKSSTAAMLAVGIALTGGGGVMGVIAPTSFIRTVGWCLALAGIACMAVAVFFASTPLERVLAEAASEGGPPGSDPSAVGTVRRPYVTLERIDGVKREYRASSRIVERVNVGDVGVAYLKAGFLVDFRPLT